MKRKSKMSRRDKMVEYLEASQHVGLNTAEWFGALVRYAWYRGRRSFKSLYNSKEFILNARIGMAVQLVLILAIIGITVIWAFYAY